MLTPFLFASIYTFVFEYVLLSIFIFECSRKDLEVMHESNKDIDINFKKMKFLTFLKIKILIFNNIK